MATVPQISSLRVGDPVEGTFACVRKDRLRARTGSTYLALELRDASGSIPARVFQHADAQAGLFERGDLVRVRGRVESFRDELVVEVEAVERAPEDPALAERFLPVAYRDRDELDGFLEHLASEVYDPGYRALLDSLLGDATLRAAWRRAPCTRAGHHAYLGGLLEHTVAVGTLARETCDLHRRLNCDLLLTAALVHDLGRTEEFTYGAEIGLTDAGRLLGHISLGIGLLERRIAAIPELDAARTLPLLHCVLTHHGAASAPGGRFACPEAVALYRINGLDAAVKGVLEHGPGGPGPGPTPAPG
jgi:3'-5' exoribonuclease